MKKVLLLSCLVALLSTHEAVGQTFLTTPPTYDDILLQGPPGSSSTYSFPGATDSRQFNFVKTSDTSVLSTGALSGTVAYSASYVGTSTATLTYPSSGTIVRPTFPSGSSYPTDYITFTYDFTGMSNGFLPSGSGFVLIDYDGSSKIENLTLYNSSGVISSPAFLDPYFYDADGTGAGSQPNPVYPNDYPVVTETNGIYSIDAANPTTSKPSLLLVSNQGITSMTFDYFSPGGIRNEIQLFSSAAIPAPEPGSAALCAAALALALRRARTGSQRLV